MRVRQLEGESAAGIREKIRKRNTVRRKSSLCESKDLLYMLIVNIYIYIYTERERERERERESWVQVTPGVIIYFLIGCKY